MLLSRAMKPCGKTLASVSAAHTLLCAVLFRRVLAPAGEEYQLGEEDMFDGLVDANSDISRGPETSGGFVTNASTDSFSQKEAWEPTSLQSNAAVEAKHEDTFTQGTCNLDDGSLSKMEGQTAMTLGELAGTGAASRPRRRRWSREKPTDTDTAQWPVVRGSIASWSPSPKRPGSPTAGDGGRNSQLQVLTEWRGETQTGVESESIEQRLREERPRNLAESSTAGRRCFRRMPGRDNRRSSGTGTGTSRRRSSARTSPDDPETRRSSTLGALVRFRRSSDANAVGAQQREMARAARRAASSRGGCVPTAAERATLAEGVPAAAAQQDPEPEPERRSSIDSGLGAHLESLLRQRGKGLIVDPDRKWIKYWNSLQLLSAVYGYTVVIWRVAFRSGAPMPRMSSDVTCAIDWATDALLYMHMALQLVIGYTDASNNKVLDSAKIVRRYLSSRRFPVHVLAGLPVDLLLQLWMWRWIPISRANRLLRVLELRGLLKHLLDAFRVRVHFQRLLWQLVMVMLFAHTIACGYFMFGSIFDGFDATSWSPPATMLDASDAIQYLDSVHWALGLMTGLADGDVPVSAHESVFTLVVMMIGIFLFATIIGNVSTMIDELNENEGVFQTKLLYMSRMMRQHQLPPQLEDRVMNYYTYQYKNHQGFDNFEMLQTLPAGLRTDIMLQLTRSMIERVPFFEGVAEGFVRSLVDRLRPQIAAAGETIVRQGQLGNEMYFVHRGEFDVLVGSPPVIVAKLRQGNYFGEALIVNKPRAATVQASTFCDLFMLTRRALTEVLAYYPETAQKMNQLVADRLEEDRAKERQAELVHRYGKKLVELLRTRQKREAMRRKQSQMMKKASFRQVGGGYLKTAASFRANKSFRFNPSPKSFSKKKVGQQPSDGVIIGGSGGKGGLDLGDLATEAEEEDVEGDEADEADEADVEADVEAKSFPSRKPCSSHDKEAEASRSAPPLRSKSTADPDMRRRSMRRRAISSEMPSPGSYSLSDGDGQTPPPPARSRVMQFAAAMDGAMDGRDSPEAGSVASAASGESSLWQRHQRHHRCGGGSGVTFGGDTPSPVRPSWVQKDAKDDDRPFEQRQASFIKRSSAFMGGSSPMSMRRLDSFRGGRNGGQQDSPLKRKLAHDVETSKRSLTPWWLARIGVTKARSREDYFFVVLPHGLLRLLWLFVLLLAVTWNVVIVPYAIAFLWGHHKLGNGPGSALPLGHFSWALGPDYASDVVFLIDLLLHQRLAFIDDQGILVKDARIIGRRSRKHRLSTALAAVLPLDALFFCAYQWCPLLRLNRLLHMGKVLTVPPDLLQAFTYTGEGRATISPYTALRIYRLLCTFFAIAHYSACLSMLVAALGTPLRSVSFALEGDTLYPNGVVIQSSFKLYLRALYWAISSLTGLGRDIKPITVGEHLFTLTVWCLGIFVFAYTIGTVGMLISNFDAGETRYNKTRNSVFRYMSYQKLPSELRARAFNFFEYTWARTKGVEIQEVVTDLNGALSTDVMSHICRDAVKNVPVFASRGDEFVSSIVQVLSFQAFPQGEWLLRKGTIGREMFFILKGEVDIIVDESLMFVIKTLTVGEFVGEGALFEDQGKRGGSVRAQTSCETMVLSKDGFRTVLEVYPDIEKDLLAASKKRHQDTQVAQKALDRRMSLGNVLRRSREANCGDTGGRRMSLGMVAQAALSSARAERRMSIGGDRARRNSIRDVATFAMERRKSIDDVARRRWTSAAKDVRANLRLSAGRDGGPGLERRCGSHASCAASSTEAATCASARQHPPRTSSESSLDERLVAGGGGSLDLLGSSSPNNRSNVSLVSDAVASSMDGGEVRPPNDPSVDGSSYMSRQHSMHAMVFSSGGSASRSVLAEATSRSPSLPRCGSTSRMTRFKGKRNDEDGNSPRCDDY